MAADPDRSLRPKTLAEYIGQQKIRENVAAYCAAARERGEALDHVLLLGPPGLGKTTLAYIIARELGAAVLTTSGPALKEPSALLSLLRRLQPHGVLFIDEVHRLDAVVEETLYPAMEDYQADMPGPDGEAGERVTLPPFTLIAATTRAGLLTAPLRDRFGIVERMGYYTADELAQIVTRSARLLRTDIDADGAMEIGRRARGTPRIANRLLRRVRDFARGVIDRARAQSGLDRLEVDQAGLDPFDRDLLRAIVDKFNGGPVGLESLAVALGEDADTIADVYEPFLIQGGWLNRSGRGRTVTARAYDHLGLPRPAGMAAPKHVSAAGGDCQKCKRPIGRARIVGQPPNLCAACHSEAKAVAALLPPGPDLFAALQRPPGEVP